jgi:hypothetical protein
MMASISQTESAVISLQMCSNLVDFDQIEDEVKNSDLWQFPHT